MYLAVRDKTDYSVKIGSTRTTPARRLAETPKHKRATFLIACATTAARELEYFLQLKYREAGKSLPGLEHFDLTLYDVLELALWFNGSTFTTQDGTPHVLTLVDEGGRPLDTLEGAAHLIGRATLEAHFADYKRMQEANELRRKQRRELIGEWAERTARRWHVEPATFDILLSQGRLDEQIQRAHEHIDQGRRPPTIPVPTHLKVYLETSLESWSQLDQALEEAANELPKGLG